MENVEPEIEANAAPVTETTEQNGTDDHDGTVEAEANNARKWNSEETPDDLKKLFLVDAIGDTLYSKRFVLRTVFNLNKVGNTLSKEYEKDLCTLWDMTVEEDVVKLLLKYKALEIFSLIIQMSEDQRLVEILLGIIANMCSLVDTRDELSDRPELIMPIIDLISCSDSLILVQLMRLFYACLVFDHTSGDEYAWFQLFRCADQFVEHFAFMLANSMNTSLLLQAFDTLNTICVKFAVLEIQPVPEPMGFRDVFVKPVLVAGVIEAFKQMLPDKPRVRDLSPDLHWTASDVHVLDDEIAAPTKRTQRIHSTFLDINVVLSQYTSASIESYNPNMTALMDCISKCLQPLCHPAHLLPLSAHEQVVIENIKDICQCLEDPFDEKCFRQMITIWSLIEQHLEKLSKREKKSSQSEWDDIDNDFMDEEEVSGVDVNMSILEYITRTSKNVSQTDFEECLRKINKDVIEALCKALIPGSGESDIRACFDKFRAAAQSLWQLEITINADEIGQRSISDIEDEADEPNDIHAIEMAENMTHAKDTIDMATNDENPHSSHQSIEMTANQWAIDRNQLFSPIFILIPPFLLYKHPFN